MKKIIASILSVLSMNLYAADLLCNIKYNQEIVSEVELSTVLNQKISIDAAKGVHAYVTERDNGRFTVEAFLADYELRIYGEGSLKDGNDFVAASAWGREIMVDINCHLSNKIH